MNQLDLDRLNELEHKIFNSPEYDEYRDLRSRLIDEERGKPEKSLIKEVNGDKYYLLLPYDTIEFRKNEWEKVHYGFDARINRANGYTVSACLALCNYEVKDILDWIKHYDEVHEPEGDPNELEWK